MAGKLKAEEVNSVLEALTGVNRSLASCLESLGENQKELEKSMKCQTYLSYSLKPVQAGFVKRENVPSGSEGSKRV